MSEFRIWCIGFFIGTGLVSFAANHASTRPEFSGPLGMAIVGAFVGAFAVMLFGRRA